MLMDPMQRDAARKASRNAVFDLARAVSNADLLAGLADVARAIEEDRPLDALKATRRLLAVEAAIENHRDPSLPVSATG
jgi:flagellar biosynthesis regulator FlbT